MARLLRWLGADGLPREVWIVVLAAFVNRAGTMVLPFLVLWLTAERGLAPARAGAYLLLYGAVAIVTAPLAGRLADRIGPLRLMRVSMLLSGTAFLSFLAASSPASVAVSTGLLALVAEGYRPAALAVLTDLAPSGRERVVFSLNRLAINLGMSVGPAVGGFLVTNSFRWLFVLDGVTSLAAAGLLFALLPADLAAHAAPPEEKTRHAAAHRDGRFLWFLLAFVPTGIVFFQHEGALPLHLVRGLGFRESAYGLLFSLNTLLIVLFEVKLNAATAHWTHRRALVVGSLLTGAGFGAYAIATSPWAVALATAVWTFGEMVFVPGSSAYVADAAPAARRGEYMGLYQMTFGLSFALGPWLGTLLLERAGATALWLAMLALALLSALLFVFLRDGKAAPRAESSGPADGNRTGSAPYDSPEPS